MEGPYWHARFALPKVNGAPKNGVGRRRHSKSKEEEEEEEVRSRSLSSSSNSPMNDDGGGGVEEGLKSEGGPGRVRRTRQLCICFGQQTGWGFLGLGWLAKEISLGQQGRNRD